MGPLVLKLGEKANGNAGAEGHHPDELYDVQCLEPETAVYGPSMATLMIARALYWMRSASIL